MADRFTQLYEIVCARWALAVKPMAQERERDYDAIPPSSSFAGGVLATASRRLEITERIATQMALRRIEVFVEVAEKYDYSVMVTESALAHLADDIRRGTEASYQRLETMNVRERDNANERPHPAAIQNLSHRCVISQEKVMGAVHDQLRVIRAEATARTDKRAASAVASSQDIDLAAVGPEAKGATPADAEGFPKTFSR